MKREKLDKLLNIYVIKMGNSLVYSIYWLMYRRISKPRGELPAIDEQDQGRWYGKKADSFCFEIIGAFLQLEQWLPPRVKQILRLEYGLYSLFNDNKKPDRASLDVTGDLFRSGGTTYLLEVNSYYSGIALGGRARGDGGFFSKLITNNYISIQTLCYSSATNPSHAEQLPNNVGIRRSPVVTTAAAQ